MGDGETGRFDAHQVEVVTKITRTSTQVEEIQRQQLEHDKSIDMQNAEIARLRGICEGSIPVIQQKLEKIQDMFETRDETAQIYYNQIREMSADFEEMSESLRKTNKYVDESMVTKNELRESTKYVMLFVKFGWLSIGTALLVAVVRELLSFLSE